MFYLFNVLINLFLLIVSAEFLYIFIPIFLLLSHHDMQGLFLQPGAYTEVLGVKLWGRVPLKLWLKYVATLAIR